MSKDIPCPDGSPKGDFYSRLLSPEENITFEQLQEFLNPQLKTKTAKHLLLRFFTSLDEIFSSKGIRNVNDYVDYSFRKHLQDEKKCGNWFLSKELKESIFGSYYYFGDPKYLLHVAVGEYNLHIGLAKYVIEKNRKLYLKAMLDEDVNILMERFKDLTTAHSLTRRNWGTKWLSIDCGGFFNVEKSGIAEAMLDFEKSQVFKERVLPLIGSLSHNNTVPAKLKTRKIHFAPYSINFRLTYKCNLECRHCYNNSDNKETLCIDRDSALRAIKEAYDYGIRILSVTGGEPFLYPKLVLEMFETAIKLGYENVSVRTNGYWGKTLKSAEEIYEKLEKIGFRYPVGSIGISAGEFHQEFLSWDHVSNIVATHNKVYKRPLLIDFEHSKGASHVVEEFRQHMMEQGLGEKTYRLNIRTGFAQVGRMKENSDRVETRLIPTQELICRPQNMFTVEPDGDIFPCCGFNRYIKGITLGNIKTSSVTEIIANSESHGPLNLLFKNNFQQIQTHLFGENHDKPNAYDSVCEACEVCFGGNEA